MIAFALETIISNKPELEATEDSREIGKEDEDCLHIADQELRPIRSSEENAVNDVGTGYLHRFGSSFDSSEQSGAAWVCTCCSYTNVNKHFETCAICGTKKENERLLEDAATARAQERLSNVCEAGAGQGASCPLEAVEDACEIREEDEDSARTADLFDQLPRDVADSMGYLDEEELAESTASDPDPSSQLEMFRSNPSYPEDKESLTGLIKAFGYLALEDPVVGLLEPLARMSLGGTEAPACNDKEKDPMEVDDQDGDRMQIDVHDPMPNDEPMWRVDEVHDPMHIDPTEEDPIPMQIETNKRKRESDDDHERSSGRAKSTSSSSCRKRNRALEDLLFVDDLLFEQRSSKRAMLAVSPASLHH